MTDPNVGDDFRATLIAAREALRLTQYDVAKSMAVVRTSVGNYEQGTCKGTLAFVRAYANAVGYELTLTPKRSGRVDMAEATTALLQATGYADRLATEDHCRTVGVNAEGGVSNARLKQLCADAHVAMGAAVYRLAEALVGAGNGSDVYGTMLALTESLTAGQEKARRQIASDDGKGA